MASLNNAALVERRQQILARLRASSAAAVGRIWDSLDNYTEAEIETFIRRASPVVAAGADRAFWLSVAHLQALLGEKLAVDSTALGDIDLDLREPFIALGRALNSGRPIEEAVAAGRARAEALGENSVQWASSRAAKAVDGNARIRGWRRALDGKACEWCARAAQQTYRTAETASFGHARCGCSVEPVVAVS